MERVYNNSNKKLNIKLSYSDICILKDFFIIGPFDSYITSEVIKELDNIISDMNQNDYDLIQWEAEV